MTKNIDYNKPTNVELSKVAANRDLDHWDPEDEHFWKKHGKKIANRNLWISISSLLCGFAVWLCCQNLHNLLGIGGVNILWPNMM
jgi:hypothetical protein